MPYTEANLTNLSADLAASLGDPDQRFWPLLELKSLVRESLRTWNAFTAYWRERRQFTTTINENFYDLSLVGSPTPVLSTASDLAFLLNDLQFALMEPYFAFTSPSEWAHFPTSGQFTSEEIFSALSRAVAQFNFDTGVMLVKEPPVPLSPLSGFIAFPEKVSDVRRVGLLDTGGFRWRLQRQDEYETQHRRNPEDLFTPGTPEGYSFILSPQPGIRLLPAPTMLGQVEAITTHSDLVPPLDLAWAVKWLALHHLLSQDGQSRDHFRASYCLKRYRDALVLGRMLPSYMIGYVNGRPAPISAISDEDSWNPGWPNTPAASPTGMLSLGWNLLALTPTPNAGPYSITLDGVVQAAIPDVDPIQIAQEHLGAILGYAKHVALFKVGGGEFAQSQHLWERFFDAAVEYNGKLAAESKNFQLMVDRAARDKEQRKVRREQAMSEGGM
jgi:hypothetical protein